MQGQTFGFFFSVPGDFCFWGKSLQSWGKCYHFDGYFRLFLINISENVLKKFTFFTQIWTIFQGMHFSSFDDKCYKIMSILPFFTPKGDQLQQCLDEGSVVVSEFIFQQGKHTEALGYLDKAKTPNALYTKAVVSSCTKRMSYFFMSIYLCNIAGDCCISSRVYIPYSIYFYF